MEYGVNVSNKFAFLSEGEDAQDEVVPTKIEQVKKDKTSALKKDTKKHVEKRVTISTTVNSTNNKENVDVRRQRRDGPNSGLRSGKNTGRRNDENATGENGFSESRVQRNARPPRDGPPRERFNNADRGIGPRRPRVPRPPRSENTDATPGDENNTVVERPNRGGGSGRGRFGRNGPSRGDRISGSDKTGVRPVPKKDGFGRGNWGNTSDELTGVTDAPNTENLNQPADAENTDNANGNAENEKSDAEPEVEATPREITLEEWKAQHKSEAPKFNTRKPGEGADKKLYQKLVPLKRETKNKTPAAEAEEIQTKREPRERTLNIEVSFNDPQRNRGQRGYREDRANNGFRGDRGDRTNRNFRGAGGSGRQNQPNFNLTAEMFPSLH